MLQSARLTIRRPRAGRVALVATALLTYLLTSGCGAISVADNTPAAPAPAAYSQLADTAAPGPRHDLGLIGVDFDPQLDVDRILNHEPVNLVVGLTNQGNRRETNVLVKADLWTADGSQRLLHTEQVVEAIAAGNVLPVRLTNTNTPPFTSRYHLTVEIVPVAGETNVQNNKRQLDILVNAAR
jgi:hypothetical protein